MRQDQYERLQALEEELTDVFLGEAKPEAWPGHGIGPGAMDKDTRGDRYWCKKNAVATLSLIQRVATLTQQIRLQSSGEGTGAAGVENPEAELDREVAAAEKEAKALLAQLQRTPDPRKAAFDRRVHGKSQR